MTDRPMTFSDHLAELRTRILRSLLAVTVAFFAAWTFHVEIYHFLATPVLSGLASHGIHGLQALQVTEAITVYLHASLIAALVVASPYLFFQVWSFVAPGLHDHEKAYVRPVVWLVSCFFLFGVVFCYFVFLPMVVDFLVGFTLESGTVDLRPTFEKTWSLITTFLFVFGLLFELPLMMFFLSFLGVVNWRKYLKYSRYFIVFAFIVGAIFTPPDPGSQLLMAIPICVLYFVGMAFGWIAGLLRGGTEQKRAIRFATGAIVIVFGALIGLAALFWQGSGQPPRGSLAVPADAKVVLRVRGASRVARAVLDWMKVPDFGPTKPRAWIQATTPDGVAWLAVDRDFDCDAGKVFGIGACLVSGQADPPRDEPGHPSLDREDLPVVGVFAKDCVTRLAPDGAVSGVDSLVVEIRTDADGWAWLAIRFHGVAIGPTEAWLRSVQTRLVPFEPPGDVVQTPLGRCLAWTGGDFEVSTGETGVSVEVAVTPARAARMVADLVGQASIRCR